ncbi:DUF1788 domain-containing protein [Lacticaseibacillus mingshuiensis]|uniref:DUF1788 domain-containing protein n=1 Tax=Lacticaseibacillus mingshuiensis TaxID=2799574 RepID=A0ABW4CEE1_9LACO|nr:DUF1788 domain-containing protein [Lacticaseibacillus mingshuiensis]
MADLNRDFDRLREKIRQPAFQRNQGLSNEVGYYIFDYRPKDELIVRENVAAIAKESTVATIGANVQVFDLFDIMMTIVDGFGYRAAFEKMEVEDGMSRVIIEMNNIMRMNQEENRIVQYIEDHLDKTQPTIIFLTGVGKVFPLIRSHKVLNTLNQVIDTSPVVMFYPGVYNGTNLKMFGELEDDHYYRAFGLRMGWNDHED